MKGLRRTEVVRTTLLSFCASLLVFTAAVMGSPASAAWAVPLTATSGSLGMVSTGVTFTPIKAGSLTGAAAGTGGTSFSSATVGTGTTFYFDVTNTSAVTMNINGTVSMTMGGGLYLNPGVAVNTCTAVWNMTLGTCSTTAVVALSQNSTSPTPSFLYGQLAPGAITHIQITSGAGLGNISIVADSNLTFTRAGIDRTAS